MARRLQNPGLKAAAAAGLTTGVCASDTPLRPLWTPCVLCGGRWVLRTPTGSHHSKMAISYTDQSLSSNYAAPTEPLIPADVPATPTKSLATQAFQRFTKPLARLR